MQNHAATRALLLLLVATRHTAAEAEWRLLEGQNLVPAAARSVQVVSAHEPVFAAPEPHAARRGAVAQGALLPLYSAVLRPGCRGAWYLVGQEAWICHDRVQVSTLPADPPFPDADGLPYRYYFVGQAGARTYLSTQAFTDEEPSTELLPGFSVAVLRTWQAPDQQTILGLSQQNYWVPLATLIKVRASTFEGDANPNLNRVGWVIADRAIVYEGPDATAAQRGAHVRLERLEIEETRNTRRGAWLRLSDGGWLKSKDVVRPRPVIAPPSGLFPQERWLDVDTLRQITTAYVGTSAVFSTLISSGRGKPGSTEETPKGEFRVWVKLRTSNMDNLEQPLANHNYSMQAVPWVMYFREGYGLHGTYWHDQFGRAKSHGCVNLSPKDAKRLFDFTSPKLPAGWTAALPTPYEPGTRIVVR